MKNKTLLFLIFTFFVLFIPHTARAQETVRCAAFEDAQLAEPDTNIRSTTLGTAISQADVISFAVTGDDSCESMQKAMECIDNGTPSDCDLAPVGSSNSTLLGMTGTARALATEDAIPVSFAYYMRDQFKNVPIVGEKVYAQDSYEDVYGASLALAVWKAFRNMALGLMSIFLVFIGIMIIMRKKVDPRTVLTLQAALPKVIISMILIVLSFGIGVTFIRFIPAVQDWSDTIFDAVTADLNMTQQNTKAPEVVFSVSSLSLVNILTTVERLGEGISTGAMAIFVGPIVLVVWLVVLMMVYVKVVFIYVRMLMQTITAPFIFAIGALPGNDAQILNWFKKMIAWLVSIPAMYFLISLAEFVMLYAIDVGMFGGSLQGFNNTFVAGVVRSMLQHMFLLLITPFISIMLLIQALSVPKKVEAFIVGEQKRR